MMPTYERREQTDTGRKRAQAVAGADALVYCPDCETSHPAMCTDDGYDVMCPNQ